MCDPPLTFIPPVRFKCPRDLRVLCRLIACHSKSNVNVGSNVRFTIDGVEHNYVVRVAVDIGRNVRCLVFTRNLGKRQLNANISFSYEEAEVVFAFNWFSPKTFWDYITLGYRLSRVHGIEQVFNMCNAASFEQAQEFLRDPTLREFVHELKLGYVPDQVSNAASHLRRSNIPLQPADVGIHENYIHAKNVTLTGFSMGASNSHAVAVMLKEIHQLPHQLRVVGFGSPRPGNEKLTEWFKANLSPDSLNVVLCDVKNMANNDVTPISAYIYDPVTLGPSSTKGFDIHPNLHILDKTDSSWLKQMTIQERQRIKFMEKEGNSVNPPSERGDPDYQDLLHSVLHYYEALTGVS